MAVFREALTRKLDVLKWADLAGGLRRKAIVGISGDSSYASS